MLQTMIIIIFTTLCQYLFEEIIEAYNIDDAGQHKQTDKNV